MTTDAAKHRPFYDTIVSLEAALAASELVGLQEEIRTLRAAVKDYADHHKDDLPTILKAMRVITQMVAAQHRLGTDKIAEAAAALKEATKEYIEAFNAPDDDV